MYSKRWIKKWFQILFILVAIIFMFNYIVDPYGYFSRENKFINNLTRTTKPEILNNKLYTNAQMYIIGTSRQMRVNPQVIENLINKPTVNVNITGSTLSENLMLAKKIKQLEKNFIYGFDCTSLNNYRIENFEEIKNRYVSYKKELEKHKNIYASLINMDITKKSIQHLKNIYRHKDYNYIENYENKHKYKINSDVIIHGVNGKQKKSSYSNYTLYSDETIMDLAKIADEDDVFVILPKYIAWYKMFQKYNNIEDKYFTGIKLLVKTTKAKVWIFYGYNSITKDSKNFDTNGWHFKPKISNLIFSKIYNNPMKNMPEDFGRLLTKENVDSVLVNLKNKLLEYKLDKKIFSKTKVVSEKESIKEPCLAKENLSFKSSKLLFKGWSHNEQQHRWSLGENVTIDFKINKKDLVGVLNLNIFTLGKQEIKIFINQNQLGIKKVNSNNAVLKLEFNPEILYDDKMNTIKFEFSNPHKPNSKDTRILAMGLKSFSFE